MDDLATMTISLVPSGLTEEFNLPAGLETIVVPQSTTRWKLSQLVNQVLDLSPRRVFDFAVNGHLLRGSLKELVLALSLSLENTLTVEYSLLVLPHDSQVFYPHPDWVSAISRFDGQLLTACYDGSLRVFPETEEPLEGSANVDPIAETKLHLRPIKAMVLVPEQQEGQKLRVITAGLDFGVVISTIERTDATYTISEVGRITGHKDHIVALAHSPALGLVATGGAEGILRIYDDASPAEPVQELTMPAIQSLAFSQNGLELLVGCNDGSLRVYTISEDGVDLAWTISSPCPVTQNGVSQCLDGTTTIVCSGDAARVWTRDGLVATVHGHTAKLSCVATSPTPAAPTLVATGDLGGGVRVSDLRAVDTAAYTRTAVQHAQGGAERVLCMEWSRGDRIYAGTSMGVRGVIVGAAGAQDDANKI